MGGEQESAEVAVLERMKAIASPRSRSSSRIVVTAGNRKATAPASAMVPRQLKLKRILVPVDFSEFSRKAVSYALSFGTQFGAEITLIHVVEPYVYPTDWVLPLPQADLPGVRAALIKELNALTDGYPLISKPILVEGRPSQEILKAAKSRKSDLIVIGTHGYSGLMHAFLGSVAERVVRGAPCPVLTVRPDERDFA
jgi:universal stress protein A